MKQMALTYSRREWTIELLLLLAEAMIVWMVASLAMAPFTSRPNPVPLWLALGLVLVAGLLPRLLHDLGIWERWFSVVITIAVVLSTLVAIRVIAFPGMPWFDATWLQESAFSLAFDDSATDIAVWAPIGLSLAVWWLTRFNGPPGLERCRSTLRNGTAVCALVAVGSSVVATGPTERETSLAIVIFFASTLIALAIARQGSEATHSLGRLVSTVLLPAMVIVAIASLLTSLVTFDPLRHLPDSPSLIGTILDPIFEIALLAVTGIALVISLPVLWLLSLGHYEPIQITPFAGGGSEDPARTAIAWHPPDPIRYLLATLVLIAIFYGVTRFSLALTRRDPEHAETGERTIGERRGFGAWLDRFRRPLRRTSSDPLAGLRDDPRWIHTVRIREIYAEWLRWARERDLGRDPAETAHELDQRTGPRLQTSAGLSALDRLTAVYDDVRYSAFPATGEQAERASRAWNDLKQAEMAHPKS